MSQQPPTPDVDPVETREWLDSLAAVIDVHGAERAHFLIDHLVDHARRHGAYLPYRATTAYVNTIPAANEPRYPGDRSIEKRIEAYIRWNAMAMVVHANRKGTELGGHIATYQSAAVLYEVGFNHVWRAPSDEHLGDLIYVQGHSSPGIYARSFLEGRLTEKQLLNFREEVDGEGIPSYPHPWLMPDYWQFPTVSMGLGPLQAIYQARFQRYLEHRGLIPVSDRKIWAFLGDGEMDEPESLGAISLASREGLDNLVFVVNCNLQRLDGPVRGNGKIIQELESNFQGNRWNVIKVVWGSRWDPLLERDRDGLLRRLMMECVDGEYQVYKSRDGAYVREHFFGKYPQLKEMVANMSDEEVWRLNRGGHDSRKIYAAYQQAIKGDGRPTVILAKTVKGWGMGKDGQAVMGTHQKKKLDSEAVRDFRDRFNIPIPDDQVDDVPLFKPGPDSPEILYMKKHREALGGYLPQRRDVAPPLPIPELSAFEALLKDSGERSFSTTMALVRILQVLTRDKKLGPHIVPIIPDEARTFGMEGMFRQLGIYSSVGQLYTPQDRDQLAFYREDIKGQILEEGISEAGAMSSWIAAATSYANSGVQMVPFYTFYSMFGFQRIGDLCWAAGDIRARGFLMGGTAGRTTLNGEGLQHEDGQSHVMAATVPNCLPYDPTYAYELAVIVQDGLRRMVAERQDVYYYITCMNENYPHPALPEGGEEGILRGLYLLQQSPSKAEVRVQLMGSGTILLEVIAAAALLESEFGVVADVWSAPSFTLLTREACSAQRYNRLHPGAEPRRSHIDRCFEGRAGPFVAATDYVRAYADQIRAFVPGPYTVLGTDGFGRSDSRANLRRFFEVDRHHVAVAALDALATAGAVDRSLVTRAIEQFGIDADRADAREL